MQKQRGRIWRVLARLWPVVLWIGKFAISAIGFAGVPDDLDKWIRWIDALWAWGGTVMTDPQVVAVAEQIVVVAEYINLWWVRSLLVILGVILLLWKWRPFWRLRHRLWFWGKKRLADAIWIDGERALSIVRASDWAHMKRPIEEPPHAFAIPLFTPRPKEAYANKMVKFDAYCKMTLQSFGDNNPNAIRHSNGNIEYDEIKLQRFLDRAAQMLVRQEFGDVPKYTIEDEDYSSVNRTD